MSDQQFKLFFSVYVTWDRKAANTHSCEAEMCDFFAPQVTKSISCCSSDNLT